MSSHLMWENRSHDTLVDDVYEFHIVQYSENSDVNAARIALAPIGMAIVIHYGSCQYEGQPTYTHHADNYESEEQFIGPLRTDWYDYISPQENDDRYYTLEEISQFQKILHDENIRLNEEDGWEVSIETHSSNQVSRIIIDDDSSDEEDEVSAPKKRKSPAGDKLKRSIGIYSPRKKRKKSKGKGKGKGKGNEPDDEGYESTDY